jgi:hypothetical protein
MGISPWRRLAIFAESISRQVTSLPNSAKQVPVVKPTYPVPTTQIRRMDYRYPLDWQLLRGRTSAPAGRKDLYTIVPGHANTIATYW